MAEINEIQTKNKHITNQQNKKLVLWKNKQDRKVPGKSDQNEEGKDTN
jgi:hypothetical protein